MNEEKIEIDNGTTQIMQQEDLTVEQQQAQPDKAMHTDHDNADQPPQLPLDAPTEQHHEEQQQQQHIEEDPLEIEQSIMETTQNLIEQIEIEMKSEPGTHQNNFAELTTVRAVQPGGVSIGDHGASETGEQGGAGDSMGLGLDAGEDDSTLQDDDLGLNEDTSLKGRA